MQVERVDYIRVPVTDMDKANHFYGELLGLPRNPNSPHEDWVEYEAGNVTLAVMTPDSHDYEFTPLPPGTLALRVPDVAAAKAELEAAGLQVNEMWDAAPASATPLVIPSSSTAATPPTRTAASLEGRGARALSRASSSGHERGALALHRSQGLRP
jgi:catechol 2,3-dioxygenase-like lactoylglutathione lyase family enzyme